MFVSAHPHFLMGVFPCIPIYGVTLPFIVSSTNRLSRPIHSKHFQDLTSTKSNKTLGKSGCFGHKSAGFLSFSIPNHFFFTKNRHFAPSKIPLFTTSKESQVLGFTVTMMARSLRTLITSPQKMLGVHHRKMVGFHGISWDFMGFHGSLNVPNFSHHPTMRCIICNGH